MSFLLRCVQLTAPGLSLLPPRRRACPAHEPELDAAGYRGSQPVRAGNGAATQTQLGTFGDLFDTIWRYVKDGHLLDPPTGRDCWPNSPTAAATCGAPRTPASGSCTTSSTTRSPRWAAGSRSTAPSSCTTRPGRRPARAPMGDERDAIKAWVNEHCWSDGQELVHLLRRHRRPGRRDTARRHDRLRPRGAARRHSRRGPAGAGARPAGLPLHRDGQGGRRVPGLLVLDGHARWPASVASTSAALMDEPSQLPTSRADRRADGPRDRGDARQRPARAQPPRPGQRSLRASDPSSPHADPQPEHRSDGPDSTTISSGLRNDFDTPASAARMSTSADHQYQRRRQVGSTDS